jgi:hypothetical protein
LVEITSVVSTPIAWPTWTAITSAWDDVISSAATFTTTALIARITSHPLGQTAAPIERRAGSELPGAVRSLLGSSGKLASSQLFRVSLTCEGIWLRIVAIPA